MRSIDLWNEQKIGTEHGLRLLFVLYLGGFRKCSKPPVSVKLGKAGWGERGSSSSCFRGLDPESVVFGVC